VSVGIEAVTDLVADFDRSLRDAWDRRLAARPHTQHAAARATPAKPPATSGEWL